MARKKTQRSTPVVHEYLPPHPDLEQACKANDIPRVYELFAAESLDPGYATRHSRRVESLDLMRCLLEHGADIETYMYWESPKSLDMVKLFVEFGYDVEAEGHKILQ